MCWNTASGHRVARGVSADLALLSRTELVLFHCTFIALKARNNLTVNMDPRECKFPNEKRLYQAYVLPLSSRHTLPSPRFIHSN